MLILGVNIHSEITPVFEVLVKSRGVSLQPPFVSLQTFTLPGRRSDV